MYRVTEDFIGIGGYKATKGLRLFVDGKYFTDVRGVAVTNVSSVNGTDKVKKVNQIADVVEV